VWLAVRPNDVAVVSTTLKFMCPFRAGNFLLQRGYCRLLHDSGAPVTVVKSLSGYGSVSVKYLDHLNWMN
jgi:hypothetical protein